MRPLTIAHLKLATPVLVAPMAGFTDLSFRLSIRPLGGIGMAFTEMLNPTSILRGGGHRRKAILATTPEDVPLGYQIYGTDPAQLSDAARWLEQNGATLIDINMGCPQRKIAGRGAGAGLLRDPALAVRVATAVLQAVRVPVTAKLRLGWDHSSLVAVDLARALADAGVAAVTVHGRTGGQGFTGKADWNAIRDVVASVGSIPVIGNGDVMSPASAEALMAQTGCAGVMIGRGVLRYPWLARDIARHLEGLPCLAPSLLDRAEFLLAHFERNIAQYGERGGVVLFRKWLPLYGRALILNRQEMVRLLQITDLEEMRAALLSIRNSVEERSNAQAQ